MNEYKSPYVKRNIEVNTYMYPDKQIGHLDTGAYNTPVKETSNFNKIINYNNIIMKRERIHVLIKNVRNGKYRTVCGQHLSGFDMEMLANIIEDNIETYEQEIEGDYEEEEEILSDAIELLNAQDVEWMGIKLEDPLD